MELESGMTIWSPGTFDCDDYPGCQYQQNGRCIFNVARLKIRPGRACYHELRQDEIECELDYLDSLRKDVVE